MRRFALLVIAVAAVMIAFRRARAHGGPKPPVQPPSGPGGVARDHASIFKHAYGNGATQFWLYEPRDPAPTSAPVVIFLHGWMAMRPPPYEPWIKHLVRRGNIVIYPRYQSWLLASPREFTANTIAAIHAALQELQSGTHTRPELDHVAVVGHSMGGAITANIAALAADEGLPQPRAVMSVEPGDGTRHVPLVNFPKADWSKIPPETLLLTVVGEDDRLAGGAYARLIFQGTPQIPRENKNFVTVLTDRHGSPALVANHFAPCSIRVAADALDYYGFWKLFDGLTDAAFYGTHREYALGNTPQQRFMGKWSDGKPVKELRVTTTP